MHKIYDGPVKRTFDILIATILLFLLSPILVITALAILLIDGWPIFFVQVRPGQFEKPFRLIKFRSMTVMSLETNASDAARVTKLGTFLRKSSIDELPELINVVLGQMSLIGPRPLLVRYLPYFRPMEKVRFNIRPGITGLAQVRGRNLASWDDRLKADVEYAQNITLLLDLQIACTTLAQVVHAKGVEVVATTKMLDLDCERKSFHEQ